jgi:hypothetical protein
MGGKLHMSRRGAAGFSYHSLLSRGWTLCRREGHRVQLRYPAFPSFKSVDEAGEVFSGDLL